MNKRRLGVTLAVATLAPLAGCEQTLVTGKVGNTHNTPAADGSCAAGQAACGTGAFARCLDLQNDHDHCGSCDEVCAAGIACISGACKQVACTDSVTMSTQTLPSVGSPALSR